MSKPTADTKWAASATKTEPSSGQKNAGWSVGQKPPAQWLNWWMDAVDQWKVWLAAFESTAHTWSALQTFGAGVTVSAGDLEVSVGKIIADNNVADHILGSTQIDGNLAVNFDAYIGGDLGVTGTANLNGAANVGGNLGVTGDMTVNDVIASGSLETIGTVDAGGGIVTEAPHDVGALGEPAFANSWVNQDGTVYRKLHFWKDSVGMVHVKGVIKSGAASLKAFTLPSGYRPTLATYFPLTLGDSTTGKPAAGFLLVFANGDVAPYFTVAGGFDQVVVDADFQKA